MLAEHPNRPPAAFWKGFGYGLLVVVLILMLQIVLLGLTTGQWTVQSAFGRSAAPWALLVLPAAAGWAWSRAEGARWRHEAEFGAREAALQAQISEVKTANHKLEQENQERRQIELIISRGKQEWEAIFDSVVDMILLTELNGDIVRVNRATIDRFQTTYQSILKQTIDAVFFSQDSFDQGRFQTIRGETTFPSLAGWFEVSCYPIYTDGRPYRNIYVIRDISESKCAQEEVLRQKQYFEALVQNSPIAIATLDLDYHIRSCNPAFESLFGYAQQEAFGFTLTDLIQAEPVTLDQARERSGASINLSSVKRRHKDGRWIDVDIFVVPVTVGGQQVGVLAMYHDITEAKLAQAQIRRQKEFFEALVQFSPVAIVVMDDHQNILSCNPSFEHLYGYRQDEVIGSNIDTLLTTSETLEEARAISQIAHTQEVHAIGQRKRKDGSLVDVEIFGVPVLMEGEKVGALGLYHDISDLVRARMEAEEADRAKSEFLANMSHEIRTPMNGVIGMLELTLDTALNAEQRDYLGTALDSAEALLSLLNDILDFSKIEARRMELEVIDFNLRTTVEEVAYTLAQRAYDKGLEMACLVHHEVPALLRGDPGRLRQILVNLSGNAIKFTNHGEVLIRAELVSETETHATVRFSVQDTGIGIPPERQAAVFDRFTQADGSTTRKYGGTGLGLAISKQLVDMMNGEMGLTSEVGVGSTFWFTAVFEKQVNPIVAPLAHTEMLYGFHILAVDDNTTNRMILTKMLKSFGCRVETAANGPEALLMLRLAAKNKDPYGLILLDMQMPGMDGEETVRALKEEPSVAHTPVIILTSMGQRGDAKRMEALGCSGYLLKPIKQQMLLDTMLSVLGKRVQNNAQPSAIVTRHNLDERKRSNIRILLAEDNPINQKLAITLLKKAGYQVETVDNGREAFERASSEYFSLILMDVQMPEMDGFEATHRLRESETGANRHVPIVAMTAHAMKGDRERCLDSGMDDYVSKPLDPQKLFMIIDRWALPVPSETAAKASAPAVPVDVIPEIAFDDTILNQVPVFDFGEALATEEPAQEESPAHPPAPTYAAYQEPFIPEGWDEPVNLRAALPRFNDDRQFFTQMFAEFVKDLDQRVVDLNQAIGQQNPVLVGRLGHNLKGLSANFCADPVTKAAAALEEMGRKGELATAERHAQTIADQIPLLHQYLHQLQNEG